MKQLGPENTWQNTYFPLHGMQWLRALEKSSYFNKKRKLFPLIYINPQHGWNIIVINLIQFSGHLPTWRKTIQNVMRWKSEILLFPVWKINFAKTLAGDFRSNDHFLIFHKFILFNISSYFFISSLFRSNFWDKSPSCWHFVCLTICPIHG